MDVKSDNERGSALVLAIFVLVLLTGMGAALLFVSENEVKMSQVDVKDKQVFYFAEAGLEHAREQLRFNNMNATPPSNKTTLNDDLLAAAGPNGVLDFDAANLKAVYDSSGNVTGFTGYGDDVPLKAMTTFGPGKYAAFLLNDPLEASPGKTNLNDTNQRAMITAIGTGAGTSLEVVQAIVKRETLPQFPSTITIVGPNPNFDGGSSSAKNYTGNDCNGTGIPGLSVPVVGVIGTAAKASADTGVQKPGTYSTGALTGTGTVSDLTSTIDPNLNNCQYLLDLAKKVRNVATVVGDSSTPTSSLGTAANPKVVFIDGDFSFTDGGGLLWVTGNLTITGNTNWNGVLIIVGKGNLQRNGSGNGVISGSVLVADVAGPDGIMWTADDCSGPDDVKGNADDGISSGTYNVNGGGSGGEVYCTNDIHNIDSEFPFVIVSFRER